MKTLVVYYSKTGNTRRVAEAVIAVLGCDSDALAYDEAAKTARGAREPGAYEHVVLLSPVWAFSLAAPMKLYLAAHKTAIKRYSLIVTCGRMGLTGCVRNCKAALGRAPDAAMKIRARDAAAGVFDVSGVVAAARGGVQ
ncbi:MAG: hypothetical protein LBT36_00635 [Oscillospiraceae bacterium]|jgi:hypothetical protein|nr:hypothetical protein [Oscillospiraceae bacterium]